MKRKPYLTCNDCGVQVFFRGKQGIRMLMEMLGHADVSVNVGAISTVIEFGQFLKKRLQEIRDEMPVLGRNPDLEIEERLVTRELERVRAVMKSELDGKKREVRALESD